MKRKTSFQWTAQDGQPQAGTGKEQNGQPISKSEKKRQALALQDLGEKILRLEPSLLTDLNLPEDLMEALCEYAKISSHEAQRRHRQHVGKLMRSLDPETIEQLKSLTNEN